MSNFVVSAIRRNYMLASHRKDGFIEWMKDMLLHSFALADSQSYLGTMQYFEDLVDEHRENPDCSRLKQLVPSVGLFHTPLSLVEAFRLYDRKYSISQRRCIAPSFNEIRHILNLAQIMNIGTNLNMISFDGDQTLYQDGGNFDYENDELALGLIRLLCNNVKVILITAAGYGLEPSRYEVRLQGLFKRFIDEEMTKEQIENFYVFGGECNYLFQATRKENMIEKQVEGEGGQIEKLVVKESVAGLIPIPSEVWQDEQITGPKPYYWPKDQIQHLLDTAERVMRQSREELKLRARILRKDRAVGIYPGGRDMLKDFPIGHGSKKLKQEALDEVVLRILEEIHKRQPPITIPYCVFNGGTDAWLDIGNKSVAVSVLQAYFNFKPSQCLHVGDQVSYNMM